MGAALEVAGLLADSGPLMKRVAYRRHGNLMYLLNFHDKAACSDDRDRIYSLLNLSRDCPWYTTDYSLSTASTYLAFAQGWIRNRGKGRPNIFGLLTTASARLIPTLKRNPNLPSWAPDFRIRLYFRASEHAAAVTACYDSLTFENSFNDNLIDMGANIRPILINDYELHLFGYVVNLCTLDCVGKTRTQCLSCFVFGTADDARKSCSPRLRRELRILRKQGGILFYFNKFCPVFFLTSCFLGKKSCFQIEFCILPRVLPRLQEASFGVRREIIVA